MRLEDDAIVLRPLEEDDAPALAAAIGDDPDLDRWTSIPFPYTEELAREFIATTEESAFAVLDRASGELLGGIGVRTRGAGKVEVGYWVKAGTRGRGVASRALTLVARHALADLGAARVQLTAEPENVASHRVAEKAGFTREGTLRSYLEIKGRRRDAVMFSLLPGDLDPLPT
ncbi:MAG TPA: GNAT family protein [Gaiellaceae bacterium]|nr:GNAT family protein [Gaiellaceae bacterium]